MTTYYVSTIGNDSNTGLTEVLSWKTIQKAADTANAGDIVNVLAGTYYEKVTFSKSGTSINNIIFQGIGKPTITYNIVTTNRDEDTIIKIKGHYIKIDGFNLIGSKDVVRIYNPVTYATISNNYIKSTTAIAGQEGFVGIYIQDGSGSYSTITNNEIHSTYFGILVAVTSTHVYGITITYNTIWTDEYKLYRDSSNATAVEAGLNGNYNNPLYLNFNVSYNKIMHSSRNAFHIKGKGHNINYNEVVPDGRAHNALEILGSYTNYIGNYIWGSNPLWDMEGNSIFNPGIFEQSHILIKDTILEDIRWRSFVLGGHQHNILVKNLKITNIGNGVAPDYVCPPELNCGGLGIENLALPTSTPVDCYTSNNIMYVDVDMDISNTSSSPITIIGLGTINLDGSWSYDDQTFINIKITGNYTYYSWWVLSHTKSFGRIHVINCNKNDVDFYNYGKDTFDNSIIFYYYVDVKVIDINGTPIEGAKVSFVANDLNIKPKNVNYTYEVYPGKTQDIDFTYTKIDGHTPLPSEASTTVAIAEFKQALNSVVSPNETKQFYTWTITAEKLSISKTATVTPNLTWYRSNPDVPVVNSQITIQIPIEILNGSVIGKIIDINGTPLENISIDINGTIVLTDINGDYGLGNLLPNTYNMIISKNNYRTITDQFIITTNEHIIKNFTMVTDCPTPICEFKITQL